MKTFFTKYFFHRQMWLWCLVVAFIEGALLIPVETDPFSQGSFINVRLGGFNQGNLFPIFLHLGRNPAMIDARLFDGNDSIFDSNVFMDSLDGTQLMIPEFLISIDLDLLSGASTLGIGPDSRFVQVHGPVSIVQITDDQFLVINSTEFGIEYCHPGSLLVVPVDAVTNTVERVEFKLTMNGHSVVATAVPQPISLNSVGSYMSLPIELTSVISWMLVSQGGVEHVVDDSGTVTTFRNCTSQMISNLPDIVISMSEYAGNVIGDIVQTAEDYIQVFPDGHECAFRFSVTLPNEQSWMNPITFAGLNIRIQNTSISFCDPIAQ